MYENENCNKMCSEKTWIKEKHGIVRRENEDNIKKDNVKFLPDSSGAKYGEMMGSCS
jgi:hypothetical protein